MRGGGGGSVGELVHDTCIGEGGGGGGGGMSMVDASTDISELGI